VFGISDPLSYTAAALLLVLSPGPATVYVLSRAYYYGRLAGFAALAGIAVADIFLITLAGGGVAAFLYAYPLAFTMLRWVGAGYLAYLGARALFSKIEQNAGDKEAPRGPRSLRRIFAVGFGVILTNPKAIFFFMAFFPQFIDPAKSQGFITVSVLGAIVIGMNTAYLTCLMLLSHRLKRGSGGNKVWQQAVTRLTGLAFIAFGVRLALG